MVSAPQNPVMSRQTLSIRLPEEMHAYIEQRVATGQYADTGEYIRDLIRRDQASQVRGRLRGLIEEGLASGPGRQRTAADEQDLLAIALGKVD